MSRRPAILVLGGTGHFGGRIARRLARLRDFRLIVSSRIAAHAEATAGDLRDQTGRDDIDGVPLDADSPDFASHLKAQNAAVVIHTAGPFQGQDYRVARACMEAGSHYVDLADGRDFVAGIGELDDDARAAGVSLISGASTLPAVSGAVVDSLACRFRDIESIESSIAPAHRTPRGVGTVRSVISYCGAPVRTWRDGEWQTVHGWQDLRRQRYPELGRRLSAACDVPDLELFPARYAGVRNVSFHAALEAEWEQLSLWSMAALTRLRVVRDWTRHAKRLSAVSRRLSRFGSDRGGMQVRIAGTANDGKRLVCSWNLIAEDNHGPEIPCTPAIILATRMARGESVPPGAYPCLGLLSMDAIEAELSDYSITMATTEGR